MTAGGTIKLVRARHTEVGRDAIEAPKTAYSPGVEIRYLAAWPASQLPRARRALAQLHTTRYTAHWDGLPVAYTEEYALAHFPTGEEEGEVFQAAPITYIDGDAAPPMPWDLDQPEVTYGS